MGTWVPTAISKMAAPSMENKEPRATGSHVDSHVSWPLGGRVAQIPGEDGREEEVESRICTGGRRGTRSKSSLTENQGSTVFVTEDGGARFVSVI